MRHRVGEGLLGVTGLGTLGFSSEKLRLSKIWVPRYVRLKTCSQDQSSAHHLQSFHVRFGPEFYTQVGFPSRWFPGHLSPAYKKKIKHGLLVEESKHAQAAVSVWCTSEYAAVKVFFFFIVCNEEI